MRFAVEAWSPEYGAPLGDDGVELDAASGPVDVTVEREPRDWAPMPPAPGARAAGTVLFVDGVRRVDARVWLAGAPGEVERAGICATYAAGVVRCDGAAEVIDHEVGRRVFACGDGVAAIDGGPGLRWEPTSVPSDDPDRLSIALQDRMADAEAAVARRCGPADLVVLDGPLRGRRDVARAIGFVKTHRTAYLPPDLLPVVGALRPGERTPLFCTGERFARLSWYLRLPGGEGHSWAGIVRCEVPADVAVAEAAAMADLVGATLPRYASEAHKDPRAPQNLYPIAGLERELRRRLGDAELVIRRLRSAAARSARAAGSAA